MLKKAAALFLVCASMAIWVSCGATSSRYLYAAIPASNEIVVYREDPNSGILTQLAGSPITAGPAVQSIVIHPSKKFLLAANAGEGDVSLFTISTTGGLNEVTPRTVVGTAPTLLAMDSAGTFLYVGNSGSLNISVFAINAGKHFGVCHQCGHFPANSDPGCRLSLLDWNESDQHPSFAVGRVSLCDRHRVSRIHRSLQSQSGSSERGFGHTVLYGNGSLRAGCCLQRRFSLHRKQAGQLDLGIHDQLGRVAHAILEFPDW